MSVAADELTGDLLDGSSSKNYYIVAELSSGDKKVYTSFQIETRKKSIEG